VEDSKLKDTQVLNGISKFNFISLRGGEYSEYNGGRTADEIVTWINKKTGPPSQLVATQEALDTLKTGNKVVAVFFGDATDAEFATFQKAAGTDDKTPYVHVFDAELSATLGVTRPALVVFRKFDEPSVTFSGEFTVATIKDFVKSKSVPTLIEFDEDYIEAIFGEHKPALFLFRDPESEEGKQLQENFTKIAEE
jgi:protein disulfide-isomerase A1